MLPERLAILSAHCSIEKREGYPSRPIRANDRFNLVIAGKYFPCAVVSVDGEQLMPGTAGVVTLRAITTDEAGILLPGTEIELREGPVVFATGRLTLSPRFE
jgi:hypothetical protein